MRGAKLTINNRSFYFNSSDFPELRPATVAGMAGDLDVVFTAGSDRSGAFGRPSQAHTPPAGGGGGSRAGCGVLS